MKRKLNKGDKVKVKNGALIGVDMHACTWEGDKTVFTVDSYITDDKVKLIAPGYGEKGSYGNGAIYVNQKDIRKIPTPKKPDISNLGMTEEEVKKYLLDRIWHHFCKWITGQTCPEHGFFHHDVARFADWILENKTTYFD